MQRDKLLGGLALGVGLAVFVIVLCYHRVVDGDLWARLAAGAAVFHGHDVMRKDVFAFTPTLPVWVDHEWGAGVIFFALLKWFGRDSLLIFKIVMGCGGLLACLLAARQNGAKLGVVALIGIPCALAILPGFVPVLRSHVLTFFFYGLLLLGLETIRRGKIWPAPLIAGMMLVWTNVHGGFVVGLGTIAVYACFVAAQRKILLVTFVASLALTALNPYGLSFWTYLIPALLLPRTMISEWAPMPLWGGWGNDPYIGFRVLCVLTLLIVALGWKRRSWLGLAILLLTSFFAWRSRRHAPFFGLAAAVYLAPYLEEVCRREFPWEIPALIANAGLAVFVVLKFLPQAGVTPLVPTSFYPVQAVDILTAAKTRGNLVLPFRWGSYAMWRLYPRVKISVDGRYEETYPDATFDMNHNFFLKQGEDWDRLLRTEHVDFILVAPQDAVVSAEDLKERSYAVVWSGPTSVLLARTDRVPELVEAIRSVVHAEPDEVNPLRFEPLDARIPDGWWK